MSLKISFETDIRGMERVEKALTTQKKLIDDSADAMKRLAGAKQGLGKTEDDTKGNESLRVTAKRIEDLTGALGTLTKSQSGLKSFMDMFGGFNKQLGEFNKTAASQVLETMTKQIDLLKASITGAGTTLKNLQSEVSQAKAAGRVEEAVTKEAEAASLGTRIMGQNALLKDLQVTRFMNRPVGQFFSDEGGGPSIAGMMKGGAGLYGAVLGGAQVVQKTAEKALSYAYSGDVSENSIFRREVGLAQASQGGDIGRSFLLKRGIGREAAMREGVTSSVDDLLSGKVSGAQAWESALLGMKHLNGVLNPFADYKNYDQLTEERGQALTSLDEKRNFGLSAVGARVNGLVRNTSYDALARKGRSENSIREILKANADLGITQQESLATLGSFAAYGDERALNGIETNPIRFNGDFAGVNSANDPRLLFSASRKMGLSDNAVQELARQNYYQAAPLNGVERAIGTAGNRSIAADRMLGDFGTNISSRNETSGSDFGEITSEAAATMAKLNQPENFVDKNPQPKLDAIAAARAGIEASQYNNQRIGTPGSLASIAQAQALNSMGIKNPIAVQQIQQLLAEGQLKESVDLISDITGRNKKSVMETINSAAGSQMRFGKALVEGDAESQRISDIMKKRGMPGLTESAMGGGINKALSTGLAAQDQGHLVFTPETMDQIETGKAPANKPRQQTQTSLDVLAAGEAKQDKEILDTVKNIAEAVGDKTGQTIVNQIAQGYIELGNKIKESVDKVSNDITPKKETPAVKPFEGGRGVGRTSAQ